MEIITTYRIEIEIATNGELLRQGCDEVGNLENRDFEIAARDAALEVEAEFSTRKIHGSGDVEFSARTVSDFHRCTGGLIGPFVQVCILCDLEESEDENMYFNEVDVWHSVNSGPLPGWISRLTTEFDESVQSAVKEAVSALVALEMKIYRVCGS